jgi:hypothetical protein
LRAASAASSGSFESLRGVGLRAATAVDRQPEEGRDGGRADSSSETRARGARPGGAEGGRVLGEGNDVCAPRGTGRARASPARATQGVWPLIDAEIGARPRLADAAARPARRRRRRSPARACAGCCPARPRW